MCSSIPALKSVPLYMTSPETQASCPSKESQKTCRMTQACNLQHPMVLLTSSLIPTHCCHCCQMVDFLLGGDSGHGKLAKPAH